MQQTTLQQAREAKGLTVAELAEKAGIDRATIYRLEDGRNVPGLATVVKLEKALGVKRGGLAFSIALSA